MQIFMRLWSSFGGEEAGRCQASTEKWSDSGTDSGCPAQNLDDIALTSTHTEEAEKSEWMARQVSLG